VGRAGEFADRFRVKEGKQFRLKDVNPNDKGGIKSKIEAEALLQAGINLLREQQEKLYAQDRWGLLLIFQAMDAAGKDGTIEHVMSGVNPQGCQVCSFKAPSPEELDHDFLWRNMRCLPERGRIGIFNRSYYEEVLVVRVHPELLAKQKIPPELVSKDIWKDRFEDINAFERYLTRNGIAIRKFFLHVSREEQRERFINRLREPQKNWKFSLTGCQERDRWKDYQDAYEEMIQHTSSGYAPWYVIPADHGWFMRLVVAAAIVDALQEMKLALPEVSAARHKELEQALAKLEAEAKDSK
jgi:PPK2 family polyphosphate:nucleotide phosphotransferase